MVTPEHVIVGLVITEAVLVLILAFVMWIR